MSREESTGLCHLYMLWCRAYEVWSHFDSECGDGRRTQYKLGAWAGGRGETFEDLADSKVLLFSSSQLPFLQLGFHPGPGPPPSLQATYQCPVEQASGPLKY